MRQKEICNHMIFKEKKKQLQNSQSFNKEHLPFERIQQGFLQQIQNKDLEQWVKIGFLTNGSEVKNYSISFSHFSFQLASFETQSTQPQRLPNYKYFIKKRMCLEKVKVEQDIERQSEQLQEMVDEDFKSSESEKIGEAEENQDCDKDGLHWSYEENLNMIMFLDFYKPLFCNRSKRKRSNLYSKLSKFMQNRTVRQCRSRYQKLMKSFRTFSRAKKHYMNLEGTQLYRQKYEGLVKIIESQPTFTPFKKVHYGRPKKIRTDKNESSVKGEQIDESPKQTIQLIRQFRINYQQNWYPQQFNQMMYWPLSSYTYPYYNPSPELSFSKDHTVKIEEQK